jgi:hypothetical protein
MTDHQLFKFDILCDMLGLTPRQKNVLTTIVDNPEWIHKQVAWELKLSIGSERTAVKDLMIIFNVRTTIALRDNIGFLLA